MRVQPLAKKREPGKLDYGEMLSLNMWGSMGRGAGFGRLRFAKGNYGDTRRIAGTYQRRRLSTDPNRYDPETNPAYPVIAMRSYRPTYANTAQQDENRKKFKAAVEYWHSLTDLEKELYDERGARKQLGGFHVAVSEFMKYYEEAPE